MSQLIETINGWSEQWLSLVWAILWQSTVLAGVAVLIAFSLRHSAPGLRYWLWQIVAIKLLLMPFWIVWVPLPFVFQAQEAAAPANSDAHGPRDGSREASPFQDAPLPPHVPAIGIDPEPVPRASWLGQITWPSWLLLAWLVVVVWQLLRIVYQRLQLGRLLQRAVPAKDERLTVLQDELSRELGLRRVPTAVLTDGECSPFVFGLWQPVLVLPQGLLAALDATQLRQVLLHELAHVKRHDLLWGWLPEIARLVYWFHPVAHFVHYCIRLERELACDQFAIALSGQGAAGYADTLVQVVSHASQPALFRAAAASGAFDGGAKGEKQDDGATRQAAPTVKGAYR